MKDHSKLLIALLLGAAAGAAVGYYLASDDKEQIVEDLKNTAGKVKDQLESELEKGKQIVEDLKGRLNDLLNKS